MISSVQNVNTGTSFKGIITGTKTSYQHGEKVSVDLFPPITSTPDMDAAIGNQLRLLGYKPDPKKTSVVSSKIEKNSSFQDLMKLLHVPANIIPTEGVFSIEDIRHANPEGKKRAIYRDIKIKIYSISIILDLNKKNQGLVSIKKLRRGLKP